MFLFCLCVHCHDQTVALCDDLARSGDGVSFAVVLCMHSVKRESWREVLSEDRSS